MIKVLLFAHLKDQAKTDQLMIEEQEITVGKLLGSLRTTYSFTNIENVMVAVNEEYAMEDDIVKSGDTVALIPPVSGG